MLSTALIPPISYLVWSASDGFSGVKWAATALAVYAACSYFIHHSPPPPPPEVPSTSTKTTYPTTLFKTKPIAFILLCGTLLSLVFVFLISPLPPRRSLKPHLWNPDSDLAKPPLPPHKLLPGSPPGNCTRKPLPPSSAFVGPGPRPDFHAFDDVLLIAFFSHPRYDVNMDGYREAYSRYFPNVSERILL